MNATRAIASCEAPAGAVHVQPDVEDPGREGGNCEEIDGTELVQGLHEGERDPDRDARPRHRESYAQEAAGRAVAEGTARLEQAEALLGEGSPGEQVDVGIEHEGEHDGRPAERADLGKPVVAGRGPAKRFAEGALDRARVFELIGDDEGEDVARHRERKEEREGEDPAPRKTVHGHEPGGARPDDDGADRHPRHEPKGVRDVDREDGGGEVAPGVVGRVDGAVDDGREGHRDEGRDGDGGGRPAVDGRRPRGAAKDGGESGHVTGGRDGGRGGAAGRSRRLPVSSARSMCVPVGGHVGLPVPRPCFVSNPIANSARRPLVPSGRKMPRAGPARHPSARRGHPHRRETAYAPEAERARV